AQITRTLQAFGFDSLAACRTGFAERGAIAVLRRQAKHRRTNLPLRRPSKANIRFTFQAMVTRLHSPCTFSSPRKRNWRNPSADLMMPKTGSGMHLTLGVERF